jgi:regulator of sigma E protease
MTTLLAFVGTIALLVLFHEFGHYLLARCFNVKVLRFSIGFGKVLYHRRFGRGETEWSISAIPLGGYVKMLDEREGAVAPHEVHRAFNRKPVLQRMAIVVAGPLANFLLAIVLYWALFVNGVPAIKPVLGEVPPDTPAAAAQMQEGETIPHVDGEPVPSWLELRWRLLDSALRQNAEAGLGEVRIEGRSAQDERLFHVLDLRGVEAKDIDGGFLDKLGLKLYQPVVEPVIGQVAEDSVAQRAGLREGDEIVAANGAPVRRWSEVVEAVRAHPEQAVQLDIRRGSETLNVTLVPQAVEEGGKRIGRIGAAPQIDRTKMEAMLTTVSYDPLAAIGQSLRKTWETSVISLKMLGKMVLGEVSMKNLSGPITIADYAGQSAGMGMVAYLGFLALISISLGVLNLLPIPLLDGGHLLYYVAELVKGSPVSEQAWEIGQKIGIALLGTLMVFAIYNDINRLISG